MTRSEMAFVFGLVLWYLRLAHGGPEVFAWLGGALVITGYFTAPRVRVTFNSELPRPSLFGVQTFGGGGSGGAGSGGGGSGGVNGAQ